MNLPRLYEMMDRAFDVEEWWPSESEFEIMIGAILTQQTNWESVGRVLEIMRHGGVLSPAYMTSMDRARLEEMIKPCGFYRQKAERVQLLARYLMDTYKGSTSSLLEKEIEEARNELLSLKGVGKETADSILLFAGHRPKFVAAAYVSRVLRRTGVFDSNSYDQVQRFVESSFPHSPDRLARLYALFVQLAKTYCRARPLCHLCPLREECPFPHQERK